MGYVQETNKLGGKAKLEIGLIRSHYIGRTFIQPDQDVRENKVKTKFNTVKGVLKDKVVVIVDDSIVRGTTSQQLVQLVKQAGPKEVHFRVTAPRRSCTRAITAWISRRRRSSLRTSAAATSRRSAEELGVDSIGYLSIEELLASAPRENGENYCTACFSGRYPVPIDKNQSKEEHEA